MWKQFLNRKDVWRENQTLGLFILEQTISAKSLTQCRWKCFPRLQIPSCGSAVYVGTVGNRFSLELDHALFTVSSLSWQSRSRKTCLQVTYVLYTYVRISLSSRLFKVMRWFFSFSIPFCVISWLCFTGAIPVKTWSSAGSCASPRHWPPGLSCNCGRAVRPSFRVGMACVLRWATEIYGGFMGSNGVSWDFMVGWWDSWRFMVGSWDFMKSLWYRDFMVV